MAEIIKHQGASAVITDEFRAELFKKIRRGHSNAEALRECGGVYDAVLVYTARETKAYLAEGIKYEDYLEEYNISKPTESRWIAAAKFVEAWARENYEAKEGEPFVMTERMVMNFVKERRARNVQTDIKTLGEERRRHMLLMKHMNGEDILDYGDFKHQMSVGPKQLDTVKEVEADLQKRDLEERHRRIAEERGYIFRDGNYLNKDGSELSDEQIAEFYIDDDGIEVWISVKNKLDKALKGLSADVLERGVKYARYVNRSSTKFKQEVDGQFNDIILIAKRIQIAFGKLKSGEFEEAERILTNGLDI